MRGARLQGCSSGHRQRLSYGQVGKSVLAISNGRGGAAPVRIARTCEQTTSSFPSALAIVVGQSQSGSARSPTITAGRQSGARRGALIMERLAPSVAPRLVSP